MCLICLSSSHHNTPVEIRESLCLSVEEVRSALTVTPIRKEPFTAIRELLVLSTCNRLEVYAIVDMPDKTEEEMRQMAVQQIRAYLHDGFGLPAERAASAFRVFYEIAAVHHLFQVAAGLDSIAIGETQILGQVSKALEDALQFGSALHVLPSLFRAAVHAGKRVHTETDIGRHPVSIFSLAFELAEEKLGDLHDAKILVVGAGKMGELAVKSLAEQGDNAIYIANRTYRRAEEMVSQYGGQAVPFEKLDEVLGKVDVVFSSTAAPQPIFNVAMLEKVMAARSGRAMMILDLAVPRNVESGVRKIPGVQLFDMDDLQDSVTSAAAGHLHQNINQANAIVDYETNEYEQLLRVVPLIGILHKKVEEIRVNEVSRVLKKMPDLDSDMVEQIDLFSRSLAKKILHEPTMHLRMETDQETFDHFADTLTHLFNLGECPYHISPVERKK